MNGRAAKACREVTLNGGKEIYRYVKRQYIRTNNVLSRTNFLKSAQVIRQQRIKNKRNSSTKAREQ